MWRILLILGLVIPFSLTVGQAQTSQEIFTPSGRMSLEIPADWMSRPFPEEEEIRGLDSEAIVMATDEQALEDFLAGQMFDGTVIFLSAYPYHVFLPEVLGDPLQMMADVTVFDLTELERKTYAEFEGAEFYYSEGDVFFANEILFDTGEMAYRSTVYSTVVDDYAAVGEILNTAKVHPVSLETALAPDQPLRTIKTTDERLSFEIPENWYFWNEGKTSLSFATSGAAYEGISYSFQPKKNEEVVFIVQRLVTSALRSKEVVEGQADLNALMTRLREENGGLKKDSDFIAGESDGQPILDGVWLVSGEKSAVRTQTRLINTGDSVYVIQAQFTSQASADMTAMINTIFSSLSYDATIAAPDPTETGLEIGQRAPNFLLNNLAGETVSLEDYLGEVIFVNMWATWCGPCHREAPDLQSYYESYGGGFEILAVNIAETQREAQGFVDEYDLTFPVLLDSVERVASLYQLRAYPTTYILSREGVIMERIEGSFSEQGLRDILAIYVGRLPEEE